jgi:Transglutaminase-like superfamily
VSIAADYSDLQATNRPQAAAHDIEPRLRFADHIYGRTIGELTIILDLKADKYFGIPTSHVELVVSGNARFAEKQSRDWLTEMQNRGVLIPSPMARSTGLQTAEISLPARGWNLQAARPVFSPRSCYRFIRSIRRVNALQDKGDLFRTVEYFRKLKASSSSHFDLDQARRVAATFFALRTTISRPHVCLHDSLVLMDLLLRNGLSPTMVFGVKLRPFEAHCWLQHGDTALNDDAGYIERYSPIMSV